MMDVDTNKLDWALGLLRAKDRTALVLRAEGYTFQEIADALPCKNRDGARLRFLRAQRTMRKLVLSPYFECMARPAAGRSTPHG